MTGFLPNPELPLFPLQTVLFPDGLLELKIFEARYLDLMSACLRGASPFGVVALKSGGEVGASQQAAEMQEVGTLAELIDVDSAEAGILFVRCRGRQRFRLGAVRQQTNSLWVGEASGLADDAPAPPRPAHQPIVQRLADAMASLAEQGASPFLEPHRLDEAGWVANRWCEVLPLPLEARQILMSMADPLARLDAVDLVLGGSRDPA